MIELYSIKDVSRIFEIREARLRYWVQSGFLWPSVRKGGRFFYTFEDLIHVKTAVELLERNIPQAKVRSALQELRKRLPDMVDRDAPLHISSDGNRVVVVDGKCAYEPDSGQTVMRFELSELDDQIAEVLAHPRAALVDDAVPDVIDLRAADTQPQALPTGFQLFQSALDAESAGDGDTAERCYRQCLAIEPTLAAAHNNLGNLLYSRGDLVGARDAFERALEHEQDQAEARFNLGNILDELGETELAIAELRQVVSHQPDFADAHYNLGVILARVGGRTQAAQHMQAYLESDPDSEWATRARDVLAEG